MNLYQLIDVNGPYFVFTWLTVLAITVLVVLAITIYSAIKTNMKVKVTFTWNNGTNVIKTTFDSPYAYNTWFTNNASQVKIIKVRV